MKKILFTLSIIAGVVLIFASIGAAPVVGIGETQEDVCPHDGGWTKIEGDDLSLYPVDGAVEYCFKGGSPQSNCESYLVYGSDISVIPTGEHVCGLSNWSYRLDDPTPTPTDKPPTETPTPTDEPPTETPTPTETPEDPTPTPTETPEETLTPTSTELPPPTETPYHPSTGINDGPVNTLAISYLAVLGLAMLGFGLLGWGWVLVRQE